MATDPDDDELSPEELAAFLKRLDAVRDDFQEMAEQVSPLVDKWLAQLAGSHLEAMRSSQDETIRRLDDPEPNLRRAAVHLAARHWQLQDTLVGRFESMAVGDPDAGVRETAISALGKCCPYASKDGRLGALLASIVRNEAEPPKVRLAAHQALIHVHGYFDYRELPGSKGIFEDRSLDDICWALVEYYASSDPQGPQ